MRTLAILALCLGQCLGTAAAADEPPRFSVTGLDGWTGKNMMERKSTQYSLVRDEGSTVLAAQCQDSASMEGWAGEVDLRQTPLLSWRWKIAQLYEGLDERVKGGSDFPARVYVVAGKRWMPWTLHTLEYAWSNGQYQAASWPSPYSGPMGQAVIVPVRSGAEGVGQWRQEQRDVQADFQQFFGLSIDKIGAVAVMSDCDDSHSQGRAWFGDLQFSPRPAPAAGNHP
jgi:hypothetical protein